MKKDYTKWSLRKLERVIGRYDRKHKRGRCEMRLTLDLLKEVEITSVKKHDRTLLRNRLTRGQQLWIETDGTIKDELGFKIAKIRNWNRIERLVL